MPLPKRSRPSFAFCLTAAEGKSMTPKIPVQITAGLKEIRIKDLILNEPQYPSGGMKERRAGSFALGGGSKACPDLFEGSFLDLLSVFYCFF